MKHTWGEEKKSRCGESLSFLDGYGHAEADCPACLRLVIEGYKQDLRDQFAMAALTGLFSQSQYPNVDAAYEYADAMMERRKR